MESFADEGADERTVVAVVQRVLDCVQPVLVPFEEHERFGGQRRNLVAQLGPDGAAGAGYEDALAHHQIADAIQIQSDRRP